MVFTQFNFSFITFSRQVFVKIFGVLKKQKKPKIISPKRGIRTNQNEFQSEGTARFLYHSATKNLFEHIVYTIGMINTTMLHVVHGLAKSCCLCNIVLLGIGIFLYLHRCHTYKILGQENTPKSLSRTFGGCSINLRQTYAVLMGKAPLICTTV